VLLYNENGKKMIERIKKEQKKSEKDIIGVKKE